jgi:hypothetical protein
MRPTLLRSVGKLVDADRPVDVGMNAFDHAGSRLCVESPTSGQRRCGEMRIDQPLHDGVAELMPGQRTVDKAFGHLACKQMAERDQRRILTPKALDDVGASL